jgi:hypothetical protein
MLVAWTIDSDTTKWADGLRFVQLQKNMLPHRNLMNNTPLSVVCARTGGCGLERTSLPKSVIDGLQTEEELVELLATAEICKAQEHPKEGGEQEDLVIMFSYLLPPHQYCKNRAILQNNTHL